ncbi:MAG: hypothetical protein U9Q38_06395 [Thermodesulfobacteriota bacterium]|nr:hypothetical protein [Thermodesulfobacteriota bacterium]
MLIPQETALSAAIRNFAEETYDKHTHGMRVIPTYEGGNLTIPLSSPLTESFTSQYGMCYQSSEEGHEDDWGDWVSEVDGDCLDSIYGHIPSNDELNVLPDITWPALMHVINAIKESPDFYGIMITFDDIRLNPLHPIVAANIANGVISIPRVFNAVVYTGQFMEDGSPSATDEALLLRILARIQVTEVAAAASSSCVADYDREAFANRAVARTLQYDYNLHTSHAPATVVIPVQLLSTGLTYPYYGIVESVYNEERGYRSRNIAPCLSGNIEAAVAGDEDAYHSTCCGSLSPAHYPSLKVLNDMNIHSLYYEDLVAYDVADYIATCIKVGAAILENITDPTQ